MFHPDCDPFLHQTQGNTSKSLAWSKRGLTSTSFSTFGTNWNVDCTECLTWHFKNPIQSSPSRPTVLFIRPFFLNNNVCVCWLGNYTILRNGFWQTYRINLADTFIQSLFTYSGAQWEFGCWWLAIWDLSNCSRNDFSSNSWSFSCCKMVVLNTEPPCHPVQGIKMCIKK